MQTLIQHGQVYTGGHLVNTDILIKDGRIQALGHDLIDPQSVDTVIDAENLLVSPGLIDVHVHYRDPGLTQKETIRTGSMAAAHGGFTTVGAMPNVDPVPDTPAKIAHMVERNQTEGVVHIKQYASITMGRLSDDLVDYAGVKDAGAFALSNDGNGVQLAGTMYRAMQGAAKAGLPIAAHVEDESLLFGGKMTLGKRSQELGIPGAPSVSESAQVARDLVLANDTGVQYHICHISMKESLAMVKFAKEKGVPVTCEASPHHLLLSDEEIHGENSNYKMNPPLRHTDDRAALQAALKDGTVDMIATDHAPHTVDDKPNDFSCAANGITGSETAFAECYTHLVKQGSLSLERLLDLMATNPADIFHLDGAGRIEVGQPADLAIFDLNHEYEIKESDYLSKGKNTPFTGDHVYGRTIYTLVDGQIVYQAKED